MKKTKLFSFLFCLFICTYFTTTFLRFIKKNMNKSQVSLSGRKSEQRQTEKDTENAAKLRTSGHGRTSKRSKGSQRSLAEHFRIRKPLNIYMIEELEKQGRKTYFQRVYILAQNIDEEKLKEFWTAALKSTSYDSQQPDFREYFQRHVDEVFAVCEKKKCTGDIFSGLFIAMGTEYTFLMIEGAEDMLSDFFEQFVAIHDKIWNNSKIFLVEDKINETYFKSFYSRRSPVININEKFPPSTPGDYKLMAAQHLKIKEKVKSLVETLSLQLKEDHIGTSKDISAHTFYLPDDPFNKLLPEIQRIDLVLKADRFYRNVKDFSQTYRILQTHPDENAYIWPIENNYTPLDIFKRSEFDVNLTFGSYGKEEKNQNEQNASHENS